jgi:hypothetical protein
MQSVEAMLQLLVFKQLLARRALQCSAFLQAVMRVLCTVVQSTVTMLQPLLFTQLCAH